MKATFAQRWKDCFGESFPGSSRHKTPTIICYCCSRSYHCSTTSSTTATQCLWLFLTWPSNGSLCWLVSFLLHRIFILFTVKNELLVTVYVEHWLMGLCVSTWWSLHLQVMAITLVFGMGILNILMRLMECIYLRWGWFLYYCTLKFFFYSSNWIISFTFLSWRWSDYIQW